MRSPSETEAAFIRDLALDSVFEGVWDWNVASGNVALSANRARLLLGEDSREAALPLSDLASRVHPEDLPVVVACMTEHLAGQTPRYECEHRIRTHAGEWRWNLHRGRVVERDADGQPLRVMGVDLDIDTRKRVEIELEQRSAQLRGVSRQLTLAQEGERRRIAQGLHDELGQLLVVARAKLARLLDDGVERDVPAQVAEVRALVDRAIGETRALTFELSSPILYEFGLVAAVESLCEQLAEESGVAFRVRAVGFPELTEDLGVLLYRAVRELCTNVVKHARATRAELRLEVEGEQLRIVVADNGEGFDAGCLPRSTGAGGLGLFGIRAACDQLAADFEIASSPGKGTRVVLRVPHG